MCSLENALGTASDVVDGTGTAWLPAATVDQIPWDGEVLLYESTSNWTRFTSADPNWAWSLVANGTIHTHTVDTYGVQAWSDGTTGYQPLTDGEGCAPNGTWPGYCMMGGYPAGTTDWTMILGLGRFRRGSFTQDAACQTTADPTQYGMYGGVSSQGWGTAGFVYIR